MLQRLQTVTPLELAKECLKDAAGDAVKATELMTSKVSADAALYRLVMDPLVKAACYDMIRKVCRDERRVVWNSPQPSAAVQKGRVTSISNATRRMLLDFRLPGGMLLREAFKPDLIAACEFYQKQADDMGVKARWILMIARRLPKDKAVGSAMTEATLRKLKQEASNA